MLQFYNKIVSKIIKQSLAVTMLTIGFAIYRMVMFTVPYLKMV